MTNFTHWCTLKALQPIGKHNARVLQSFDDAKGIATLAASLPNAYAESESLAKIAELFGKDGVAKFLRNKLPTKASARSGDMGEILATAYLQEECGYVVGPSRLVHRDHQEWAMRGDDVLGATVDSNGRLRLTRAEAKSRATMDNSTVKAAREGLQRNGGLPSPHSLTQFAERLLQISDSRIGEGIIAMQLEDGVRPNRVGHLMFLFTGSDPSAYVAADLNAYSGPVSQLTVTLRVKGHQKLIKNTYERVINGGS